MISRRIATVLLFGCLAFPALIFVRDLGATPAPATSAQASFDGKRILDAIIPGCGSRCSVKLLGQSGAHTWRLRLSTGNWYRCYDLDPVAFGFDGNHGFSGAKLAPCRI
jgi:hypothetical protein